MQYDSGRPRAARCQVGLVRVPETGEIQLASQIVGRAMFILPPHSAAVIIGALREGLTAL
ncbi:hypothetical protein [Actinophytocola sp.]|uniref:hypothetical protein n=1 Tax=Actinophytocola sp. TaxID=1872138 RepID=UPI002ED4A1A3